MNPSISYFSGLVLAVSLASLSLWLSPVIGVSSVLLALLAGIMVSFVLSFGAKRNALLQSKGLAWSEKQGLGLAIALMGFQMPWQVLMSSGGEALLLVCAGLLFTFVVSFLLSRLFRLSQPQGILMATGNGICGSAAVMATQSIIKSNRADTAMVVTLVNLLGLIGIVVTPLLVTEWFPEQSLQSGQLIGNTLQSMPHVVTAGFAVNDEVAQTAVWVKMIRILMLLPVLFSLAWWQSRQKTMSNGNTQQLPWLALVPVFIWGFILLAVLNLIVPLPQRLLQLAEQLSDALMCMALVAIGVQIQWQKILQSGGKLLFMGVLLFALQLAFSGFLVAYL